MCFMRWRMGSALRSPLWNRIHLGLALRKSCTVPASRIHGRLSAVDDGSGPTEILRYRDGQTITLTSRPMTSTRLKLAAKRAVWSVRMKPSGRIPTVTGWSGTPLQRKGLRSLPSHSVCFLHLSLEHIDGRCSPGILPQTGWRGSSYTSWGLAHLHEESRPS